MIPLRLKPGKEPEYKGLWTLYWKDRSFFGNTRPLGFFIGFQEHRFLIFLPSDGKHRLVAIQWPSGKQRIFQWYAIR